MSISLKWSVGGYFFLDEGDDGGVEVQCGGREGGEGREQRLTYIPPASSRVPISHM